MRTSSSTMSTSTTPSGYSLHPDNLSTASTSVLPQPGEAGYAPESLLTRGLQVPSRSDLVTSGFLYPDVLAHYDVSREHWDQFTREITNEARLSRSQWQTVVGRGLGAFAVGGLMVGFLASIPAVWVGRRTRRNREEQNLIKATTEGSGRPDASYKESNLSLKIDRWNETYFAPRGILIRVDLPFEELEEMQTMDISTSRNFHQRTGSSGTRGVVQALKTKNDQAAREDASRRARVVIIPQSSGYDGIKG